MEEAEGRTCSLCKEYKTREYFGVHKGKIRSQCKACEKEYRDSTKELRAVASNKYYETNKETIAERQKLYAQQNKEKIGARTQAWYESNKEEILRKGREDYQNNKEQIQARHRAYNLVNADKLKETAFLYRLAHKEAAQRRSKEWSENNKSRVKEISHNWYIKNKRKCHLKVVNRNAVKAALPGAFDTTHVEALFKRQLGLCVFCGEPLSEYFEIDHIIPVSRDGSSNYPHNLQLTCRPCNRAKGDKLDSEFVEWLSKIDQPKHEKYLKHQEYIETKRLLSDWRI